MPNPEFPTYRTEKQTIDPERAFTRYPGLRETLIWWCARSGADEGPLSFSQVVQIMMDDRGAQKAVRDFLGKDPVVGLDPEVAGGKREELAWALVDALSQNR